MLMSPKIRTAKQQAKFNLEAACFDQLVSRVLPFMSAYTDDLLIHDRESLSIRGALQYIHIARHTGTCLYTLFPADHERWPAKGVEVPYLFGKADRYHILDQAADCIRGEKHRVETGDARLTHYFDGKKLREIEISRALDIALAHQHSIRTEWSR